MAVAPVLRLVGPPPPAPLRLVLRAPPKPAVAPLEAAAPTGATAVGITGASGTRVIMVPADLTQEGRVDITQFRIALAAGTW